MKTVWALLTNYFDLSSGNYKYVVEYSLKLGFIIGLIVGISILIKS
ncbi:hypothetical protein [Amphibacillus indicireducens]|uniref:Uncharacterized protein n=1 Tax=Amphibacillus indicireducens TaxID=1076330 RepID=A0ABP7V3M9_9BACI